MNTITDEAEVIIRLDKQDQQAHITVHAWGSLSRKLEKRYGKSLDGDSESSRRWIVPLRAIAFRNPNKSSRKGNPNFMRDMVVKTQEP